VIGAATVGARFLGAVLDSLPDHVAVIGATGSIEWVNRAWVEFGRDNGAPDRTTWVGASYIDACRPTRGGSSGGPRGIAEDLRELIEGRRSEISHEYPCHSPDRKRWFLMRGLPLHLAGPPRFVISHQDITERRILEEEARTRAVLDPLTGVPNRRRLDQFLEAEWRRAQRSRSPVSVAMIDIDEFKAFNDLHGHLAGDACLRRVATALQGVARRPGDLLARYGGEEFVLVLGGTDEAAATHVAETARAVVERLGLEHGAAPGREVVTVSAGVATARPGPGCQRSKWRLCCSVMAPGG
jgi:diguanylate cyclase (GGDEF)-like protein